MILDDFSLTVSLERLYQKHPDDPGFAAVLAQAPATDDHTLADVIEADGRLRLRLDRPVTLDRYMLAVADLERRADALDAAIDMTLRSLARTGRVDGGTITTLVDAYPGLETSIREAAALNNALWSTNRMRTQLVSWTQRPLPTPFGPMTGSGRHRYELRELLGEGAYGQVYLAVDEQLSEEGHPALVSIKVMPGSDRSPRARQALIEEATKARRVSHPNVVRVIDRGVTREDEDYVVYEFVEGGDLGRFMRRKRGARDQRWAVGVMARIARGVHAAHMAGLVHCDLKPSNVVLTAEGEPKVADFGVAIRAGEDEADDRETGAPVGNLAFMSPEQFRMEPGALTIPTDGYALGGMLHWMLTGELPNGGTAPAIRAAHERVAAAPDAPHPAFADDRVPFDLRAITARAMATRPAERYGSAATFADDLEHWLAYRPIAWTRPGLLRRLRLWTRRKPGLAATTAIIVLVTLISGVVVQQFASVARQNRIDAAYESFRADLQEQARQRSREELDAQIGAVGSAIDAGLGVQVLPQIWLMEWLFGPTVMDDSDARIDVWTARIDIVRDTLEKQRAAGRADSVTTRTWETALAFWLVHEGNPAEAEALLADNIAAWRRIIPPADPWLVDLDALHACATVARLEDRGELEGTARTELERLADALDAGERALAGTAGSPLHLLVLRKLVALERPGRLDRPARLREHRDAIERLD